MIPLEMGMEGKKIPRIFIRWAICQLLSIGEIYQILLGRF